MMIGEDKIEVIEAVLLIKVEDMMIEDLETMTEIEDMEETPMKEGLE